MARMIYADDLYEAMNQVGAFEVLKDKRKELFTSAWGVPIVDAEEVVRCKDCKWRDVSEECVAYEAFWSLGDDGFCSLGERKDEVEG